jgi:hypothetical protein
VKPQTTVALLLIERLENLFFGLHHYELAWLQIQCLLRRPALEPSLQEGVAFGAVDQRQAWQEAVVRPLKLVEQVDEQAAHHRQRANVS